MHNPLTLTFSISIQCIVYLNPDDYEPGVDECEGHLWRKVKELSTQLSHNDKLRIIARQSIVHVLKQANLPTYDVTDPISDQKWTVAPLNASHPHQHSNHFQPYDSFLDCPLELQSPTFHFYPKAFHRIAHAVRILTTNFNADVDDSCAFHVRIGTLRKGGFPLQTLKHLCMLTALFEHHFNTLHPPHHINHPRAKPPSAIFSSPALIHNPWDVVTTIQNCKSLLDLVLLYAHSERRPDENSAYNLVPLLMTRGPHHHHHHPTMIEFRQHAATLNWREMSSWIQVVGGVVDAVHHFTIRGGRNAWPERTKLWPTIMLLAGSALTILLSLITLLSYCGCFSNKARRSWKLTVAKYAIHISVWIVISTLYRYEKGLHGVDDDLWGWSCSAKAAAIQGEFTGVVNFSSLCSAQSRSWEISIAEVVVKMLFALGHFVIYRKTRVDEKQHLANGIGGAGTDFIEDAF